MNAPAVAADRQWTAWPKVTAVALGVLFVCAVFNRDVNAFLWLLALGTDWASEASPCGDAGPFEKLA